MRPHEIVSPGHNLGLPGAGQRSNAETSSAWRSIFVIAAWRLPQLRKQRLDRRLQVARAGQQAVMVEQALHQPGAMRADAGHGFEAGKVGICHPVRQIAERPVSRCDQPLAQASGQDGAADRELALRRLWFGRTQSRAARFLALQGAADMAELGGGEPPPAADLAIGHAGRTQVARLFDVEAGLLRLAQHRASAARAANHGPIRRSASSTRSVDTAKLKRMKWWPSTGSKSIPGAVATPVSSSSRMQNAMLSSVRWPISA